MKSFIRLNKTLKSYERTILTACCLGFAILLALTLSAFTFNPDKIVTRYDLACTLQKIIQNALPDIEVRENTVVYSDLSASERENISLVIDYQVMSGYQDKTFRPFQKIYNRDFLGYLSRTAKFLQINASNCRETRELKKIIGFAGSSFYESVKSSFSIFGENAAANDLSEYAVLTKLEELFNLRAPIDEHLHGRLLNAISNRPIASAFVAVAGKIFVSGQDGTFSFVAPAEKEKYEILISAEGYYPLFLKRNKMQRTDLNLKLKPIKTSALIHARSAVSNALIKDFQVELDGMLTINSIDGKAVFDKLAYGYHSFRITAPGYEVIEKCAGTLDDDTLIEALLSKS